jgi:hypothetical protein
MLGETATAPAAASSPTMFETVAADRPDRPAISTCVMAPFWRIVDSTRALLASLSEAWEPGLVRDAFTA